MILSVNPTSGVKFIDPETKGHCYAYPGYGGTFTKGRMFATQAFMSLWEALDFPTEEKVDLEEMLELARDMRKVYA